MHVGMMNIHHHINPSPLRLGVTISEWYVIKMALIWQRKRKLDISLVSLWLFLLYEGYI